jgi:hypothetical protein
MPQLASPSFRSLFSAEISASQEHVRLDPRILDWLRSKGQGRLTRVNDIPTNLMEAEGRIGAGDGATPCLESERIARPANLIAPCSLGSDSWKSTPFMIWYIYQIMNGVDEHK